VNASVDDAVLIRQENHLGRITVNRPAQINALTHPMIRRVREALTRWRDDSQVQVVLVDGAGERGLCAGADIRMLHQGISGDTSAAAAAFLADEYKMNSALGHYPKPVVAYMSGITLGGGVGISGHCSVRVVTESSKVGMPETAIGLCPDVGGLYLLSRSPGELGTHGALTGAKFGPSDAIYAGLADHFVPSGQLDALTERLRQGMVPPDIGRHPAPEPELLAEQGWIDECYAGDDVGIILNRLAGRPEPAAQSAATVLAAMSPTALKVTLQATRRAAELTLDEVLAQDFRVCSRFLEHPDLAEGIRAMIIDKDRKPRWNPGRLTEVSAADVDAFFAPLDHSG